MTLKVMADNRVEISAKQDGAVYNVALGDKDFIIEGLGDEFAMSYTGLVVSVESGEAVVHGRHITADETEQITLPQNQRGYLVLRIDLTQVSGAEAMLYTTPTLTNEEINWSGNIYDMPIATFTTSNTAVTNFEDVRKISGSFYPTKVSELENDSGYALKSYVDNQNLLNPTLQTGSSSGVTCTANGDGTYTLNGTASDATYFTIIGNGYIVPQRVKMIGSVASPKAILQAYDATHSRWVRSGDIIEKGSVLNSFSIYIPKSNVCSNEVVKPMFTTYLDATYDDYKPYSESFAYGSEITSLNNALTNLNLNVNTMRESQVTGSSVQLPPEHRAFYICCSYGTEERMIGIAFADSTTSRRNYKGEVHGTTIEVSINWSNFIATITKSGGDTGNTVVFFRPLYAKA